jgi:hypothetical protein
VEAQTFEAVQVFGKLSKKAYFLKRKIIAQKTNAISDKIIKHSFFETFKS